MPFEIEMMGQWESEEFAAKANSRIQELNLESHFKFLGVQFGEDKNRRFARAEVFCFPTHFECETFGLGLLEAMSFGLPVVASNLRGIPSVVDEGETGFLFERLTGRRPIGWHGLPTIGNARNAWEAGQGQVRTRIYFSAACQSAFASRCLRRPVWLSKPSPKWKSSGSSSSDRTPLHRHALERSMNSGPSMIKRLVAAQTPPPYGGMPIMIQLLDSEVAGVKLVHVRFSFRRMRTRSAGSASQRS